MHCDGYGVSYQADRSHLVTYDADYFGKCSSYDGLPIADVINAGRIALVAKHFGWGRVVDVGIGSGEFIRRRGNTFGVDVNPAARAWLVSEGLWADDLDGFSAFTFWDVIEHVDAPEDYLQHIPVGGWAFFSLPIFEDLERVRESRHYRPGEHLQYFTAFGLMYWMTMHGFAIRDWQTFETEAGRDSIGSFAFQRVSEAPTP